MPGYHGSDQPAATVLESFVGTSVKPSLAVSADMKSSAAPTRMASLTDRPPHLSASFIPAWMLRDLDDVELEDVTSRADEVDSCAGAHAGKNATFMRQ
jgi:hypothetical protein